MKVIWGLVVGTSIAAMIAYTMSGQNMPSPDKVKLEQEAINLTPIPSGGYAKHDDSSTLSYSYSFTITYPEKASAFYHATAESKALVAKTLQLLMAAGHRPAKDGTSIWVWTDYRASPGVTGEERVMTVGRARYESVGDGITFAACTWDFSTNRIRCADD
jgi:hypothetical protein